MSGPAFDTEFLRAMVSGHEEAIAKFQREAAGSGTPIATMARETIPTLEKLSL